MKTRVLTEQRPRHQAVGCKLCGRPRDERSRVRQKFRIAKRAQRAEGGR